MSDGPDFGARIPFTGPDGPVGPTAFADCLHSRSLARERAPEGSDIGISAELDARRIRRALALPSYREHKLEMACFNNEERNAIERRLTTDERLRVVWRVSFDWPPRARSAGGPP